MKFKFGRIPKNTTIKHPSLDKKPPTAEIPDAYKQFSTQYYIKATSLNNLKITNSRKDPNASIENIDGEKAFINPTCNLMTWLNYQIRNHPVISGILALGLVTGLGGRHFYNERQETLPTQDQETLKNEYAVKLTARSMTQQPEIYKLTDNCGGQIKKLLKLNENKKIPIVNENYGNGCYYISQEAPKTTEEWKKAANFFYKTEQQLKKAYKNAGNDWPFTIFNLQNTNTNQQKKGKEQKEKEKFNPEEALRELFKNNPQEMVKIENLVKEKKYFGASEMLEDLLENDPKVKNFLQGVAYDPKHMKAHYPIVSALQAYLNIENTDALLGPKTFETIKNMKDQ